MSEGKLEWTKSPDGWVGIWGKFRATVKRPVNPFQLYHWSVFTTRDERGGSGGTSSAIASKRAAEIELDRFAKFLRLKRQLTESGGTEQTNSRDPNL
jgi:hypothetical protein